MNKTELMENYTSEQLADKYLRLQEEFNRYVEVIKGIVSELPEELKNGTEFHLEISRLQSEVEKYRKAFEDAKKERDCQIAEYWNRVDKDKSELERAKNTINQIDDILERLFGVRHDTAGKTDEFEKILKQKAESYNTIADYLCDEPISVAQTLISAKRSYELSAEEKQRSGLEKGYYHIFDVSELKQIAEHLLIYCNHNKEE